MTSPVLERSHRARRENQPPRGGVPKSASPHPAVTHRRRSHLQRAPFFPLLYFKHPILEGASYPAHETPNGTSKETPARDDVNEATSV